MHDSEQSVVRGQHARFLCHGVVALLLIALFTGCASHAPRPAIASDGSDAEAQVHGDPALALHEDDPATQVAVEPPPLQPIWPRLTAGYRLADIQHPRIDTETRRLLRSPAALYALLARAEPYLYHIVDAVESAGIPGELALLPAIESGFRPHAYSPDGAVGLWQFMPATGRMMGLKQDWWFESRRTVRASTAAAIAYLKRLNARFDGDWLHTLAAYNAGSAKVGRAIRRAGKRREPTDFWSLDLPGETDRYVPRLLALARVLGDPERHGLSLPEIADAPYFAVARTAGQIDLNVAAGAAGMPVEDLLGLNAGHRRWATPPDGPHELLLPADKVAEFERAVTALTTEQRLRWQRHTIRPGDSLNRIARDYAVTVDAIRRTNGLRGSRIRAGETLLIPLSDAVTLASASSNRQARQRLRYRVRKGDSLYAIARRFQVSIKDLKRWNRVGRYIRPGERLTVFVDPDA
ncbi:MAG: transglycosylase SLT domain-containing protein [Gammaproteobacteria bacterium]|nr:transglycosylase SLT domain-containing protein [Gammaproteobacteria bacterium]